MNKRSSHAAKSLSDRNAYQRALAKTDSDPTLDESLDFNSSTKIGSDLIEPTSKKKRPVPFKIKFRNAISEYGFQLIFGAVAIGILFLVNEARVNFQSIQKDIAIQQKQLDQLIATVDDNSSKREQEIRDMQSDIDELRDDANDVVNINNIQDVVLAEIKLRLEFLTNQIDK